MIINNKEWLNNEAGQARHQLCAELLNNSKGAEFAEDSHQAIILNQNDSLLGVKLGTPDIQLLGFAQTFKLAKNSPWVAYMERSADRNLILLNTLTAVRRKFSSVSDYLFGESGKVLLLHLQSENKEALVWIDLNIGSADTIWEGKKAMNFVLDKKDSVLAFSESGTETGLKNSFWFYRAGQKKAKPLTFSKDAGTDSALQIEVLSRFNNDGNLLFCYCIKKESLPKLRSGAVSLDLWSYMDTKLQPAQLNDVGTNRCLAVINIKNNNQLTQLVGENEVQMQPYFGDDIQLVTHRDNNSGSEEYFWNGSSTGTEYVIHAKDNKRIPITQLKGASPDAFNLSPEKKYVVYYDAQKGNYFSFNTLTYVTRNITKKIKTDWSVYGIESGLSAYGDGAVSAWIKGGSTVLLHDQNDIWKIDLSGKTQPVNLTNGYGKKHNTFFRLAIDDGKAVVSPDDTLLLVAFNRTNKNNGFFSKQMGKPGDPELLTVGPYMYEYPINAEFGAVPCKARDANSYIVKRMNASESPNYYSTTDFKTFTQLSAIYPEKSYNWMTTELVNWQTPTGVKCQGILYKPENLDTTKKYPIIFYYYEKLSDQLHVYVEPDKAYGRLNISNYVSNGYLVFTPDIHYKIGEPGESVVDCVVSAANFLAKRSWVDSKKMGLQGHSWGGCETNYLITHSHLFAAAASGSGLFDAISEYGGVSADGGSINHMYEISQFRIGAPLWKRPDLYIENSPIFKVDKVTTPLLMMHTKDDGICLFANAVEFFTALRRLGKKAWMLQYDGYNHSVAGKAADDFTIRMQQFFDHYLKGKPAPRWMVEGIPAKMKGIDTGLDLMPAGVEPGKGLNQK